MTPDEVQPAGDGASAVVTGGSPPEEPEREPASPEVEEQSSGAAAPVEGQAEQAPRRQRAARGGRAARGQRGGTATAEEPAVFQPPPPPRLLETYRTEIVPALVREFGFTSPMQAPRVQKIVLNVGVGEALTNSRAMEGVTNDLAIITGQKPIITRARKSIAGFKIREGNPIGAAVTLRGARMYYFLDRLINVALPRIRDFRGIQRGGFDGRGNFSIGIREQIIFPEIDYNQIDRIRGLQVTIATSARNDQEAIRLLELYGMPFVRQA